MKAEQFVWCGSDGWSANFPGTLATRAQLVLVFGSTGNLNDHQILSQIRSAYPTAYVLGCSTAGEIAGDRVHDDSVVVTAAAFDQAALVAAEIELSAVSDSFHAGQMLARCLDPRGLRHVLVLSDGLKVNGSELVKGLTQTLGADVSVSGGLSADGGLFQRTLVYNGATASEGKVAAIGFYGAGLRIGCASMGGWQPFGPHRAVTRADSNVLYELDGQSALDLYKTYLGEHAQNLPASGLLFPLSIRRAGQNRDIVRTILSVNEADHSLTFAGDIPQGSLARLMHASFERLIEGAYGAAQGTQSRPDIGSVDLAILISCVGRKLVLKQRVEEEVEAVREVFGPAAVLAGFYSYGEISPFGPSAPCELHNQTMTITTFSEV